MPKYRVELLREVRDVIAAYVEVDADDADKATEAALEMERDGLLMFECRYESDPGDAPTTVGDVTLED